MIYNLHLLRVLAALAVVYFHTTSEAGLMLPVNIGSHGVDVFFVISGFIIAYIGARSPEHFFVRRLIRIVPFYWAATLAVFCAALLFPNLMRTTQADVTQLLYSLLFIPHETPSAGLMPTLILGWSLNYEMYFYVLFAASLLLSRRWAPVLCAGLITAVALNIDGSATANPTLHFYGRPLVFEFGFGIACYYLLVLAERHHNRLRRLRGGMAACLLLCALALTAIGVEEYEGQWNLPRFVAAGVPAMVLVLSALVLERVYSISAKSRIVFVLGESSYILYLIHPYIVYTVLRVVFPHARAFSATATAVLIVVLLAGSAAIAALIHYGFELPLMQFLRAKLLPAARERNQRANTFGIVTRHRNQSLVTSGSIGTRRTS
jgi:exopolysaccharide production protein ExoZ